GEVLARYVDDCGPRQKNPVALASCIKALAPFWADLMCDAVKGSTCRRYTRWRAEGQEATPEEAVNGYLDASGKRMRYRTRDGVAWTREPAGSSTCRRDLGVLQAALNHAHAEGLLVHPIKVSLPPSGKPRERYMTGAEADALLKACTVPHLRMFLLLALYSGRREKAITGLQWLPNTVGDGHVDLARGVIKFIGAGPESKKAKGAIRIPAPLLRHLRAWRRRNPRAKHVIEWQGERVRSVRKALETARRRAGLPDVSAHVAKHTAVTWAFQRGMTMEQAEEWFSTSAATLRAVYRQHSPEHQKAQAEIMGKSWKSGA
ncbi:MAG: hypothetical protein VXW57_06980, partial [Pseudomonadota bacterium]|nr:hypothetical protein [Pseudomonadota bacterium]